jgi:hypothetical protein
MAQGSLGAQKFILNTGQIALGDPDSLYTALQSHVFGAAGDLVLPAGIWMVLAVADISVQICTDGDTAWSTLIAADEGGLVISDGYNVRLSASGAATAQYVGLA